MRPAWVVMVRDKMKMFPLEDFDSRPKEDMV